MHDLIARLEAATEGSRVLDAEIHLAIGERCGMGSDGLYLPPHYTQSVDAALTLVPEGWRWDELSRDVDWGPGPERSYAVSIDFYEMPSGRWLRNQSAAHDLLPVALCIAALRARKEP